MNGEERLEVSRELFLLAILGGDRKTAVNVVLELLDKGHAPHDLYVEIFQESLYEVGRRWERNDITVAEEHMATAIAQYALGLLYERMALPPRLLGRIVIGGAEGEMHQIGAHIVADALDAGGWDVRFLGGSCPTEDIVEAVRAHHADVFGLSVTLLDNLPQAQQVIEAVRQRLGADAPRIIVGGAAFRRAPDTWRDIGADAFFEDVRALFQPSLEGPVSLALGEGRALPGEVTVEPEGGIVRLETDAEGLAERGSGWRLLGNALRHHDDALSDQLLSINSEMSTLRRENVRKTRELQRAMAELELAQSMLVHQEKMSSLGRVTAGVAHEINNPLAFVISNHVTMQRDVDDLMRLLDIVTEASGELRVGCPDLAARLFEVSEEIDPPYLRAALREKIADNLEGLRRIKEIVLDLRRFSRLDEATLKMCTLEEGLQATVRFITPLLDEREVAVETDFAPLPPLLCNPGQLNQAVDNILTNAVLASRAGQVVRLTTRQEGDEQVIEVADHGEGIAPEHLGRVFEPFFTGRPAGAGSGLGLSIAHQVVSAHKGRIIIDSKRGEGTVVRILLPAAPT